MATDRPIVVYDTKQKGKDADGNDIEFDAPSNGAIEEAIERWKNRKPLKNHQK